jgi:hypothetical protein
VVEHQLGKPEAQNSNPSITKKIKKERKEKNKNLKLICKHKRLQIAKPILNKKTNAGGITISNFKLH